MYTPYQSLHGGTLDIILEPQSCKVDVVVESANTCKIEVSLAASYDIGEMRFGEWLFVTS